MPFILTHPKLNLLRENWLRNRKTPKLARFGHSWQKMKKPPLRRLMKLLIIKKLMAEPTGSKGATSNVTGQNSLFQIWLKHRQNWHLEKHQQLCRSIVALFMRNILDTFWARFGVHFYRFSFKFPNWLKT
jgi:hypothetical protein